jgi:hypothetical protein
MFPSLHPKTEKKRIKQKGKDVREGREVGKGEGTHDFIKGKFQQSLGSGDTGPKMEREGRKEGGRESPRGRGEGGREVKRMYRRRERAHLMRRGP